jgi:hypothetical protein
MVESRGTVHVRTADGCNTDGDAILTPPS